MGRKRDLSDFVKGQVETLHSEGYSQCHIACKLKISRCAVQNVLKSDGVDGRKNCGRKRKTNSRQDRIMKAAVVRSPHASSARIAHNMRADGIEVSDRTVRRRLSTEFNLVARRPAKKPLITKKQLQARLRFCKSLRDKPITWWDNVMFSDESTFQQVRGTGSNYVRRPVGQRLNPKYTLKTVKHPPSVMVWGAITSRGRCGLKVFDKGVRVNAAMYVRVLDEKLKVHMNITGATIFQQDSAPSHTAKVVQHWFKDNNIQTLLNWPPNSPDLNVIENCWQLMKKKVAAHHPTSEAHLKTILKDVWIHEITPEYCQQLVHSMPMRIAAVLKNHGYPTKY
jgi:predicted transcriptional regulator